MPAQPGVLGVWVLQADAIGDCEDLTRTLAQVSGNRRSARSTWLMCGMLRGAPDGSRHRIVSWFSREHDLVFCAESGRTIGHRNITARGLTKAAARTDLEGVTFHALRHTFASLLIAQGNDVVFVSRQLGHANPAITLKVYAHLFDAERHADGARRRLQDEYGSMLSTRHD